MWTLPYKVTSSTQTWHQIDRIFEIGEVENTSIVQVSTCAMWMGKFSRFLQSWTDVVKVPKVGLTISRMRRKLISICCYISHEVAFIDVKSSFRRTVLKRQHIIMFMHPAHLINVSMSILRALALTWLWFELSPFHAGNWGMLMSRL